MTALERLADRCGIQHVSEDAFGKEHVTSPETKRALLKAMHLAADTEEQAQSSLKRIEAAEWSRTLPPVVVAYSQGKPLGVPHYLHKRDRSGSLDRAVRECRDGRRNHRFRRVETPGDPKRARASGAATPSSPVQLALGVSPAHRRDSG